MEEDWKIIQCIISLAKPLSCEAIAALLNTPSRRVSNLIERRLQAVFFVAEESRAIFTFHASFPEFLIDCSSDRLFKYNEIAQQLNLAHASFVMLEKSLRFNICDLPSSFIPDDEVEGLKE